MNTRSLTFLALLAVSAAASANEQIDIPSIAQQTGLTERQVRMALGAPSAFAEYRTSYAFATDKVRRALGTEKFREAVAAMKAAQQSAGTQRSSGTP